MVIDRTDLKEINETVKKHLDYDVTTILFLPENGVKKNNLIFCPGYEDIQLFYRDHPYDKDRYKLIDAHLVSKVIDKIERESYSQRSFGIPIVQGKKYIDLGVMVNEQKLTDQLHHKMKYADWYYDYSDDFQVWLRGNMEIKTIKEDLKELSQSAEGMKSASKLWEMYVPQHSVVKPDFLQIKH